MSQIEELREILIGANADELALLKRRIESVESRTKDVAEVLAPAINNADISALASSLQNPVSLSLKNAIRSDSKEYAEMLYPVMAPAIRRAISQAISSLLITINRTLESATSVSGLKTRVQAMRTGMPYAELALRRSLLYRVEHVYLIDRESGMQVAKVSADDTSGLDGDAVSAMFSAIQSFVQDSFSQDRSALLTDLKVGDHNVWVANGPKLMLACVILGDAPEGLKSDLHDALYKIRTDYAVSLASMDMDPPELEGVDSILQPLLQLRLKEDGQENDTTANNASSGRFGIPFIVLGLIVCYMSYQWFVHNNTLSTVNYYLKKEPGIAVTDIYWQGNKVVVEGLKDPDAVIPYGIFQAYQIERDRLDFQTIPFRSLEVEMESKRFRNELALPAGVSLIIQDDTISLVGEAPIDWLNLNNDRIRQLASDRRLSIATLSASVASVDALLKLNFSARDLKLIGMPFLDKEGNTILHINSALDPIKLALVNTLFSVNAWVTIVLKKTEFKARKLVPILEKGVNRPLNDAKDDQASIRE